MKLFVFKTLMLVLILTVGLGCKSGNDKQKALITTPYGDITVELFNSTPLHRDNFIKLVNEGFYNGLLFHRVIDQFMIQGGDPMSKTSGPGSALGGGDVGYQIAAEIGAPHVRGALAAARTPNPEKKSSGCQFYIVTGVPVNAAMLEQIEMSKNIKYNDAQRALYLEQGGSPHLDMEYTVFGQVLSGMEVADKISKVVTDERNRPLEDLKMSIKLID